MMNFFPSLVKGFHSTSNIMQSVDDFYLKYSDWRNGIYSICERLVQKNINDGRRFNITVNNVDIPDQAVFKPSYLWLQAPILSPNISISYFDFFHHFPLRLN